VSADIVLDIRGLTTTLRGRQGDQRIVEGVDLTVRRGEFVALVGESGSGKSLTCLSIGGVLPAGIEIESGEILLGGRDISRLSRRQMQDLRGRELSMVFQDSMTSLNPTMRVGQQIMEPLLLHKLASKAQAQARAVELLELVDFPRPREFAQLYPHELSGGMRQRVAIAMALAVVPKLLVADEPTTALDATVQTQVLRLLKDVQKRLGLSVLMVSHDLQTVSQVADKIFVMYAGTVVESGETDRIVQQPKHPYTAELLACMPAVALARHTRLRQIAGSVPERGQMPPGCRFHPRCARAEDQCRTVVPSAAGDRDQSWRCFHPIPSGTGLSPIAAATSVIERSPNSAETRPETAPVAGTPLIEARDLVRRYRLRGHGPWGLGRSETVAVDDVSFELSPTETVGVVGESGSGKSTLGRLLVALEGADAGSVRFQGRELSRIRPRDLRRARRGFQMMFQDSYSAVDRRMSVADILAEPLVIHAIGDKATRASAVATMLDSVGLPRSAASRYPRELSGGQRQRVGLGRALMLNPNVIVADEPVSALDVSIQAQVLNLMQDLKSERALSYVFISHDLSVVRYMSDRIAVMYLGRLVETGPAAAVYQAPLHPYTAALLQAVNHDAGLRGHTTDEQGEPDTTHTAIGREGCMYRARCPFADERCATERPPLVGVDGPRSVACHHPLRIGSPA
jgi:oligopeptide/dipeptide ABC transporter ATP-binding protein